MSIKKYIIKVLIILIILTINMMFVQKSYVSATDFMAEGKKFLTKGGDEYEVINKDALQGTSKSLFKTLLSIAICVSVIVGAVLGFQFILGSVEGKAKVSEALVPYIVGCVIVFGSFTIWKVFINIGQSAEDKISTEKTITETYSGIKTYKDVNYEELKDKYGFAENKFDLEEIKGYYTEKYGEYINVTCKWEYNNSTYKMYPAITKKEVWEEAFKKIKENKDKSCVIEYMSNTNTKFTVSEEYTEEITITISE